MYKIKIFYLHLVTFWPLCDLVYGQYALYIGRIYSKMLAEFYKPICLLFYEININT